MVVAMKKKANSGAPSVSTIRHRAATIRREWSAKEHFERHHLAALCQRVLMIELLAGH